MKKYIIEKMKKIYCKNEKLIILLFKICRDNDIKQAKKYIENFYNNK